MEFKHIPIMLDDCIKGLNIRPDGVYVDATIGGAGHSREIASRLSHEGTLIGIDRDKEALDVSKERLSTFPCKKHFVHSTYEEYASILRDLGIDKVDGILVDLGVSSYQLDNPERGFSYMREARLDMRMDRTQALSAYEVVNEYDEKDLSDIFFKYGEEQFSRSIARNIVRSRATKPIETTTELTKIIESSIPSKMLHKGSNPSKKVFQAIRIEVNGELVGLENVLKDMIKSLRPGGRLCVITFHSLEDRIVKDVFKLESTDCICPKTLPVCVCHHKASVKLVTKKFIAPSEQELSVNKRSASSKLRIIEKI